MSLRCFWCQHYLMEKNATNELGEEISTFQKLSPKLFVSKRIKNHRKSKKKSTKIAAYLNKEILRNIQKYYEISRNAQNIHKTGEIKLSKA